MMNYQQLKLIYIILKTRVFRLHIFILRIFQKAKIHGLLDLVTDIFQLQKLIGI